MHERRLRHVASLTGRSRSVNRHHVGHGRAEVTSLLHVVRQVLSTVHVDSAEAIHLVEHTVTELLALIHDSAAHILLLQALT